MTLNLAQEEDRLYMNSFMSEVGSYLESVLTIEEKNRKRIEEKQNKSGKKAAEGCGFGCMMAVGAVPLLLEQLAQGGMGSDYSFSAHWFCGWFSFRCSR